MAKKKPTVRPPYSLNLSDITSPQKKQEREPVPACFVCGCTLHKDRLKALIALRITPENWTCVTHSVTKKILGQYMGEHGTSELKLVDRIDNTSVRGMFRKGKEETDDDDSE